MVRAGLESIVNSSGRLTAVDLAASLDDLLEIMGSRQPDVLLADLDSAPGRELSEILQAAGAVVTLTDDDGGEPLDDALRLGGRAVLPRNASAPEIQAAVEGAASGLVVLHPDRTTMLSAGIPRQRSEPAEHLTPREIEVLGMLAEGVGNKTIARRLGISEHTVKFHVGSIMGKLNAGSRTEAVTTGVREGLIMV